MSKKSQENTCVRVSFLIILQNLKTQVFSCEFCEIFKNSFFTEQVRTTASGQMSLGNCSCQYVRVIFLTEQFGEFFYVQALLINNQWGISNISQCLLMRFLRRRHFVVMKSKLDFVRSSHRRCCVKKLFLKSRKFYRKTPVLESLCKALRPATPTNTGVFL